MGRDHMPEEEAATLETAQAEEAEAQEEEPQAVDGHLQCHKRRHKELAATETSK